MSRRTLASLLTLAITAVGFATGAAPSTALAECTFVDDWPLFREGAPSATLVVAGRVRDVAADRRGSDLVRFTLDISEVLRGHAPARLVVDGVASSRSCIPAPLVVSPGDRVVIAIGPARTGVTGPIASVAFLGRPPRGVGGYPLMPRMQRLTLRHVRQLLDLPSADLVFFTADDGRHGRELWRTDGTRGGTRLVRDVRKVGSADPEELTVAGGLLFFTADDGIHGRELWVSDGTALGTHLASDVRPGPRGSDRRWLTAYGNDLLFGADDGVHGCELWEWQDSASGGHMVRDLRRPGGSRPGSDPRDIVAVSSAAWYSANDGVHGRELWTLDRYGFDHPLHLDDIHPGRLGSRPGDPALVDHGPFQGAFFTADDGTTGTQGWRLDPARMAEVDLAETGDPSTFVGVVGPLLSVAGIRDDGPRLMVSRWVRAAPTSSAGGIPGATVQAPGHAETLPLIVTRPGETATAIVGPTALDRRRAVLGVTHPDGTGTVWVTDGTVAGTHPLAPVEGGPAATSLVAIGGRAFVATADPAGIGAELWVTDGLPTTMHVVADIRRGGDARVRSLTGYHSNVVLVADDGTHGAEPWSSDGSRGGTRLALDVRPGPLGSDPRDLTPMNFRRVPTDDGAMPRPPH